MRFTPVLRIASSRLCVSRVPLSKSTNGSFAAAAMSELAARWNTTSWPAMALATARCIGDVPLDDRQFRGADALAEMLAPPGEKIVEHGHRAEAAVQDRIDEIRAEKSGAAGNEKTHGHRIA